MSHRRGRILKHPGIWIAAAVLVILFAYPGLGTRPRHPLLHTNLLDIHPQDRISRAALDEDIDSLVSWVAAIHADPYQNLSAADFRRQADSLKDRLRAGKADSLRLVDCYYHLQWLAATLQDEHTDIQFPQPWLEDFEGLFPLRVRILEDRFYAARVLNGGGIPPFAEIVSINGRLVEEMLPEMLRYQNSTLHHCRLESIQETFDLWLYAFFGMRSPWVIEYRQGDLLQTAELPGLNAEAVRELIRPDDMYSTSAFGVGGVTVPVLELPKFRYGDRDAYEDFVDDFFDTHRDKPYIVIDVRRNSVGAGAWSTYVLDYLTDAEYRVRDRFDHRISEPYREIIRWTVRCAYYDAGIPKVLWWGPFERFTNSYFKGRVEKLLQAEDSTYVAWGEDTRLPDPGKAKFEGTAILLTSHHTNSAAVAFAAAFQANELGVIVGQETGGRVGCSSDPIAVELPNTKLRLNIPVAVLLLPGSNPDLGVFPDFPVWYLLEDHAQERDRDMEAVRDLIERELSGD